MRCSTGPRNAGRIRVKGQPVKATLSSVRLDETTTKSDGNGSLPNGKKTFYRYYVDMGSRHCQNRLRKRLFRTRPENYLKEGSNGSLPLEEQAFFQSASKALHVVRELRISAVRSMTNGRKSWRRLQNRISTIRDNVMSGDSINLVNRLISRYCTWCLKEIKRVHRILFTHFGIAEVDMATCPSDKSFKPSFLLRSKVYG